MDQDRPFMDEMIAYYRARAPEYDQWFLRQGRYFRGEEQRRSWQAAAAVVEEALRQAQPRGDVLELACGTGLWTRHLVGQAASLTAVDASPEAIAINRQRVGDGRVEYRVADLFTWKPGRQYDFAFFGFWLSHVPAGRFVPFWEGVRGALRPGGRVFFVDSLLESGSAAIDHRPPDPSGLSERKLNDGRTFTIVKVFYEPGLLEQRLADLGWHGSVRAAGPHFLYGCVQPATG
ncbi:MAG: class I SAM-dependent methyltransferase [Candidatus Latescibacterota bacterium]